MGKTHLAHFIWISGQTRSSLNSKLEIPAWDKWLNTKVFLSFHITFEGKTSAERIQIIQSHTLVTICSLKFNFKDLPKRLYIYIVPPFQFQVSVTQHRYFWKKIIRLFEKKCYVIPFKVYSNWKDECRSA